jgi:putative MATE family efflux protein
MSGLPERLSWWRLGLPQAAGSATYQIVVLIDVLFVSTISDASVAGVAVAALLLFLLESVTFGFCEAGGVAFGQALGTRDAARGGQYVGAAIVVAAMTIVVAVVFVFAASVALPLFLGEAGARAAAGDYMRVMAFGYIFLLVSHTSFNLLAASGNTRSPAAAFVVTSLINLGLDYLMVIHLRWGVAGSALSTVVSYAVNAGILLYAARALPRPRRPTRAQVVHVLRLGIGTALQNLSGNAGWLVTATFVVSLGADVVAVHHVAGNALYLQLAPALGFAVAAKVISSRATGAEAFGDIVKEYRRGLRITLGLTIAVVVCACVSAPWWTGLVLDSALGAQLLVLVMVAGGVLNVAEAWMQVARSTLNGAGDVSFAAKLAFWMSAVVSPIFSALLAFPIGLGLLGVWLGRLPQMVVGATLLHLRIVRGSWISDARRRVATLYGRAHVRYQCRIPIEVQTSAGVVPALLLEASMGGGRISLEAALDVGAKLAIWLPDARTPVEATVVRRLERGPSTHGDVLALQFTSETQAEVASVIADLERLRT